MPIHCEACGRTVPEMGVDPRRGVATCPACGHSFLCQAQLDDEVLRAALRRQAPVPPGMHLSLQADGVLITRRWFGRMFFRLVFIGLCWNLFMAVWYQVTVTRGQWSPASFLGLYASVNAGLLYGIAAAVLNSTRVRAGSQGLEVRLGPLPWIGNRRLLATDLRQLYTREQIRRSRHGRYVTYEVWAELASGKDTRLAGGMPREDQARFVQEQVEAACGLNA